MAGEEREVAGEERDVGGAACEALEPPRPHVFIEGCSKTLEYLCLGFCHDVDDSTNPNPCGSLRRSFICSPEIDGYTLVLRT